MAGKTKTPGAVHPTYFINPYLMGPLGRMLDVTSSATATTGQIKAIWRNEPGQAAARREGCDPCAS